MKKIFALLLIAALSITVFAACSENTDTPDTPDPTTVAAIVDETTVAPVVDDDPADIGNAPASLEELAAQANAAMAEVNANSNGMFTAEVKADGKKLVYIYTYAMDLPTEALQPALDAAADAYGSGIGGYKDMGYDIDAIVIEFVNQSGEVLASKEFK